MISFVSFLVGFSLFIFFTSLTVFLLWEVKDYRRVTVLQEGSPGGKTFLLIAGFNQPVTSWQFLLDDQVFDPKDRILALPRRLNEVIRGKHLFYPLGWIGFKAQTEDAIGCIKALTKSGEIPSQFWVIGHSLGASIAQNMAEALPKAVIGLTLLCPPPNKRFSLLTHGQFWLKGGLLALVPATLGLLRITWGFKPWQVSIRGLYTGPKVDRATLQAYQDSLVADSTAAFISLLFFYKGGALRRAINNGYAGQTHVVLCPGDNIFRAEDIRADRLLEPERIQYELSSTTPHCIGFETNPEIRGLNSQLLRLAIGHSSHP